MMTVRDAAQYLGISPSKLYALAGRRLIPHYRLGGRILFEEADLSAFKETCRVEAGSSPAPTRFLAPRRSQPRVFTELDPARLVKAWKDRGVL